MNRRTKIMVSVAGIFIILLALLGITCAYFLTRINGNSNDKSISVTTANLELTYGDNSAEILGSGTTLMPSNSPIGTKEFTVTNNGEATNYLVVVEGISIKDLNNNTTTFESNDFRYTLTCKKKDSTPCDNQTEDKKSFPLNDGILINNDISKNDEHTYTLTMYYIETGLDQSNDMGKSLSARINIMYSSKMNPYSSNKNLLAYNIINNSMNRNGGTEFREIPLTVPAQEMSLRD